MPRSLPTPRRPRARAHSIKLLFENVYFNNVREKCASIQRLDDLIIFSKSFNAPLLKCGSDSDTIDISNPGFFAALCIRIGMIPNVLPADVPPGTILIRLVSFLSLRIAVVYIKSFVTE